MQLQAAKLLLGFSGKTYARFSPRHDRLSSEVICSACSVNASFGFRSPTYLTKEEEEEEAEVSRAAYVVFLHYTK